MITIQELKGNFLKKALNLSSASFRYHNKNNHGGNFGINLLRGNYGDENYEGYEINGNYDIKGIVYGLSYGKIFWGISRIPKEITEINQLIEFLKLNLKKEIQ